MQILIELLTERKRIEDNIHIYIYIYRSYIWSWLTEEVDSWSLTSASAAHIDAQEEWQPHCSLNISTSKNLTLKNKIKRDDQLSRWPLLRWICELSHERRWLENWRHEHHHEKSIFYMFIVYCQLSLIGGKAIIISFFYLITNLFSWHVIKIANN